MKSFSCFEQPNLKLNQTNSYFVPKKVDTNHNRTYSMNLSYGSQKSDDNQEVGK